jgi:hypothetical protein
MQKISRVRSRWITPSWNRQARRLVGSSTTRWCRNASGLAKNEIATLRPVRLRAEAIEEVTYAALQLGFP